MSLSHGDEQTDHQIFEGKVVSSLGSDFGLVAGGNVPSSDELVTDGQRASLVSDAVVRVEGLTSESGALSTACLIGSGDVYLSVSDMLGHTTWCTTWAAIDLTSFSSSAFNASFQVYPGGSPNARLDQLS